MTTATPSKRKAAGSRASVANAYQASGLSRNASEKEGENHV